MWFKNILIFKFNKPCTLTAEQLEHALDAFKFHPCASQEKQRIGFTPVLGKTAQQLVHTVAEQHFVSMTKEEKHIPTHVIQEALQERIEALEEKEGRFLRKQEKQALKDDVIIQLLPRAFSRYSRAHALILPQENILLVDAPSRSQAEAMLALLRKALGSLPVVPLEFEQSVSHTLTEWIKQGHAPQPFSLLQEAELKDISEEGAVVRLKQQELHEKEVIAHLEAGKMVEKLALEYNDATQFILTKDGSLKRLKFSKELTSTHDELKDNPQAHLDANLNLMSHEIKQILNHLMGCLV
tara:strand:- start:14246 stop:15136 length:891 start_codon:yes stop_codon:yes gene_type:complete